LRGFREALAFLVFAVQRLGFCRLKNVDVLLPAIRRLRRISEGQSMEFMLSRTHSVSLLRSKTGLPYAEQSTDSLRTRSRDVP
jgi:hypothetical protein